MQSKMEFKEIASLGRTFEEYLKLFSLNEYLLNGKKILDVASGCCSFCAEANAQGFAVTATDRIYNQSPDWIKNKFQNDLKEAMRQLPEVSHLYKWELYKNVTELENQRQKAFDMFYGDFKANRERYLAASFPDTGFATGQFDISLVAHFLFIWDDRLDYHFHKDTINELIRITKEEIRIFPLVTMGGERSLFVEPLIMELESKGHMTQIQKVDYEILKGGNQMLVISNL